MGVGVDAFKFIFATNKVKNIYFFSVDNSDTDMIYIAPYGFCLKLTQTKMKMIMKTEAKLVVLITG